MCADIQFETPENIRISYQPSGLGTRFVAWFVDNILLMFLGVVLLIVLICSGIATDSVVRRIEEPLREVAEEMDDSDPNQARQFTLYFLGIWTLVWGVGSFFYYGLSELLLRGQTVGKRLCAIRVVKADGFSLDAGSILVRNIFRVVDHLPPLWIVPVISTRAQRFGDMVAGTVVIADRPEEMSNLREVLSRRSVAESKFRFDNATLKRARRSDIEAVERILERWNELNDEQQDALLDQMIAPLAARLKTDRPDAADGLPFLEDLLAAEYRRQSRRLG